MRKVTTINLNNNAYQIDEDGFEALRAYLDSATRALATNPDRDEILSDLEQAIADKCRLTLGPHKTVVSLADIERILQEMGPVAGVTEGTAGDASGAAGQPGATAAGASGFRARRLYRIREGAMWGGVCQGLAAYTGIDVSLVRVAVVLLTIFPSFFLGIFVYIVMCFVVPAATTPEELAAAHGQPFRAQELVDRVKKKHDDFRNSRREKRRMRHSAGWWSPQPASQPPPGYAARVTGGVLLPLLTVLSAAWFAVMALAAFLLWQGWPVVGFEALPRGSWWQDHGDFPRWVALAIVFLVYALFAIPIGAARRASLYYANGGRMHGWADAWSGLLWIALVAVVALAAWYLMPQLQDLLRFHLHGPNVISAWALQT